MEARDQIAKEIEKLQSLAATPVRMRSAALPVAPPRLLLQGSLGSTSAGASFVGAPLEELVALAGDGLVTPLPTWRQSSQKSVGDALEVQVLTLAIDGPMPPLPTARLSSRTPRLSSGPTPLLSFTTQPPLASFVAPPQSLSPPRGLLGSSRSLGVSSSAPSIGLRTLSPPPSVAWQPGRLSPTPRSGRRSVSSLTDTPGTSFARNSPVAQYAVPNSMPVMSVPQFPTDLPQGRLAYVPPAVGSVSSMGSATVSLMPQGKCDASSATGSVSGTRSPRGSSTRSVGSSPPRMTSPLYTSYAVPPAASPVLPPQCEIAQGDNCHSWQRLSPGTVKPRAGNVPQMRCQISTSSTLSATSSAARETTPLRAMYTPQVVRQSSCGPSTHLPAVVKIASTAPTEPTMIMPVVPGPDGVHSARFPTDHSIVSMDPAVGVRAPEASSQTSVSSPAVAFRDEGNESGGLQSSYELPPQADGNPADRGILQYVPPYGDIYSRA